MMLFKKQSSTPICEVLELKTFAQKSKGLIGDTVPSGAYFRTRFGIHTFGMKFPIDVIIADESFRVRKIKKSLGPGNLFFWNPSFANVFELPSGTISVAVIQKGDFLELRP